MPVFNRFSTGISRFSQYLVGLSSFLSHLAGRFRIMVKDYEDEQPIEVDHYFFRNVYRNTGF